MGENTRESRGGLKPPDPRQRRRKSHGTLRLRLWGRRLLATWLCLLRTRAARLDPAAPNHDTGGRRAFMTANQRRQEELRRVFLPYYHFCPDCGSACCREGEIPYSALDRRLYRMQASHGDDMPKSAGGGAHPTLGNRGYVSCFQWSYLHRKLRRFIEASGPVEWEAEVRCPALTAAGCRLPWGERPAICVSCACPQILAAMDWATYGRYAWVNLKYLAHLSLALRPARDNE